MEYGAYDGVVGAVSYRIAARIRGGFVRGRANSMRATEDAVSRLPRARFEGVARDGDDATCRVSKHLHRRRARGREFTFEIRTCIRVQTA